MLRTEEPFIPTLQIPDAPPLDLKPVEFVIQSGNVCMTPESYKNLSENTELIRQWMILQREITSQYRVFYEEPLLKK